ncbi:hypothetical protein [Ancylobacter lacus]|uniref:hypothetical protein n=1 Tax=Ancylobacter lacus TaxID=2579970 RepID=UPI001BCCF61D|nr:hypothetical protein [Ancylobacter lacus]MBS7540001.1 hypothetical protein [Ancylobacter lacus]
MGDSILLRACLQMREPDLVPFLPGLPGILMDPSRAFDAQAFPSCGAGMIGSAFDLSPFSPPV